MWQIRTIQPEMHLGSFDYHKITPWKLFIFQTALLIRHYSWQKRQILKLYAYSLCIRWNTVRDSKGEADHYALFVSGTPWYRQQGYFLPVTPCSRGRPTCIFFFCGGKLRPNIETMWSINEIEWTGGEPNIVDHFPSAVIRWQDILFTLFPYTTLFRSRSESVV